jgi:penicillin-insensitive murein endopeptidase
MPRAGAPLLVIAAAACALAGCASRQILGEDGSVSYGPSNAGALLAPAALPLDGIGYRVPPIWRRRGLRYGTDELVGLIQHVGREVARVAPGRSLAVADLSPGRGGPSHWHRSHQTGRDVDLVFFARDAAGAPVEIEAMRRFDGDGRGLPQRDPAGQPMPDVTFDDAANWALVRALVENPVAPVQYAFISEELRLRLLDHAEAIGEPPALIAAAAALLRQPGDSAAHDDHLHVRVFCSPRDRERGCRDAGSLAWRKKAWKYEVAPASVQPGSTASSGGTGWSPPGA